MTHSQKPWIVIKYGGNAMTDDAVKKTVMESISKLHQSGFRVLLVHGGGPFIKKLLALAGVQSRFEDGQRVTDPQTMKFVEMALSAEVNGDLVKKLKKAGVSAVGISGKDGNLALVEKRFHTIKHADGSTEKVDIGFVGSVVKVDTLLIESLSQNGFLPVISPVSSGLHDGMDYNVNADTFAGSIAGAVGAEFYVVLTDVDGIMSAYPDSNSLISHLTLNDINQKPPYITGGMIPKIESCTHALLAGAKNAFILNGTKPGILEKTFIDHQNTGTRITL